LLQGQDLTTVADRGWTGSGTGTVEQPPAGFWDEHWERSDPMVELTGTPAEHDHKPSMVNGHSVLDVPAGVVLAYGACELCRRPFYRLTRHEMLNDDGCPVGPMLASVPWWDARD